jgi:hypothetical protein
MKMKKNQENALKKQNENHSITENFKNNLHTVQKKCTHISVASFIWSHIGYSLAIFFNLLRRENKDPTEMARQIKKQHYLSIFN